MDRQTGTNRYINLQRDGHVDLQIDRHECTDKPTDLPTYKLEGHPRSERIP